MDFCSETVNYSTKSIDLDQKLLGLRQVLLIESIIKNNGFDMVKELFEKAGMSISFTEKGTYIVTLN